MIKGNERRVVVVKGDKESPYEMACIFMRDNTELACGDIVKDAEEIIRKALYERVCMSNPKKERNQKLFRPWLYFCGLFSGILASYLIYAVIVFGFGYGL